MEISTLAGPFHHARRALGTEPVLWAAFAVHVKFDVQGLDADGRKKANIGLRVAGSFVDAAFGGEGTDAHTRPGSGPTDVVVFSPNSDSLAMRRIDQLIANRDSKEPVRRQRSLWAMTPHRLYVGDLIESAPKPADISAKGFFKELAQTFSGRERESVQSMSPGAPVFDIPRAEIARLVVAKRYRKPCLRMELRDGSGFDLVFEGQLRLGHDLEADQYDRLLALSLGRTDPWV